MHVGMMRHIDRFAGIPLCWVIGIYRTLFSRKQNGLPVLSINRILIIKFFGMGSILLSTPALSLLRKQFPHAKICFLSFSANKELLGRISIINDVQTIDTSSMTRFVSDTINVLKHFRSHSFDVVFDFEFFSKYSTALSGLSGAPMRVAFALPTRWRSMLVTHSVPLSKDQHVSAAFCQQVFTLTGKQAIPELITPAILESDSASMMKKVALNGKPAVCINVNAGETFLERRWPPEYFAKLVSNLSKEKDYEFYFIGLKTEHHYVQSVIELTNCIQQCHNVAGILTLLELMALLQKSQLLISNDSGPLHLAASLGVRTIGLYGPETPVFYGPIGNHTSTIYKSISCSPCMNVYDSKSFKCPYNARCMKEITVDEVQKLISELVHVS